MRAQRGQSTVEFVLIVPAVFLMLLVVVQVALLAHERVLIGHATQEAARSISIDGDEPTARQRVTRALPGAWVRFGTEGDDVIVEVEARVRAIVPVFDRLLSGSTFRERVIVRRLW